MRKLVKALWNKRVSSLLGISGLSVARPSTLIKSNGVGWACLAGFDFPTEAASIAAGWLMGEFIPNAAPKTRNAYHPTRGTAGPRKRSIENHRDSHNRFLAGKRDGRLGAHREIVKTR